MSKTTTAARSEFGEKLFQGLAALPSSSRMSSEQLEVIYALAYAHVTQGQYAQALPIFFILTHYGPTRKHYLLGLALCLQRCQRYAEAIHIYSMADVLFPGGPELALRVAECQLMQGDRAEAREELGRVQRCIAEAGGEYDEWKPRTEVLMDLAQRETA